MGITHITRQKSAGAKHLARDVIASWIEGLIHGGEIEAHSLMQQAPTDVRDAAVEEVKNICARLRAGKA